MWFITAGGCTGEPGNVCSTARIIAITIAAGAPWPETSATMTPNWCGPIGMTS